MQTGRLTMPFDSELISEINSERYEMLKSGQIQFSHPEDQHDDRLWALALACYGIRFVTEIPHYKPAIAFGKAIKPKWQVGGNWSTRLPRS